MMSNPAMPHRILVVLSTVFKTHGGIPRFNQMLGLAFDQLCPELELGVTIVSQDDTLEDYREHGAPWRHAEFLEGGGRRALVRRAHALCRRDRPDLLLIGHLGMTPLGLLCWPWLRGGYGFVAHGTEAWDEPRWTRRFAARHASFALSVSQFTADALAEQTGLSPEAIRIFPNTLDPGFEMDLGESDERGLELLSVARLWADQKGKGVDHTLRAFATLAPRFPDARLRIVGKGSDKPRLVELSRSLRIEPRVIFQEGVTDEELAERYRHCAVFVLPSGQEGFGIVFLEAMRYSKPCIGGSTGGTPEVIEDGRTGILVPFGDEAALATALERLLSDPGLRREMGRAGHQRLAERFVFDRYRDRLAAILRELLGIG